MRLFCPTGQTASWRALEPWQPNFFNDLSTVHGVVFAFFIFPLPNPRNKLPPHALQHLLDMGDRRLRLDAVAEIEDQPPLRKIRQHVVDRAVERGAA
jgi:hypothetical protein